jgi:hypothetical protein
MSYLIILGTIFIVSLIFGYIKYLGNVYYKYDHLKDIKSSSKNAPWQWKFVEIWGSFVGYFFGGLIGYYFICVRLKPILSGETLNVADFILLFIFGLCITGWLPYFFKNITEGINAIINKFLK